MPGIDRSRVVGRVDAELDEFTCVICQDIFDEPVVTQCCRQSFCTICIHQWLEDNNTCPYDRKSLTVRQLLPVPLFMSNLLNKLEIKCENYGNGCDSVLTFEEMANHMKTCNTCDSCKTLKKSLKKKQNELALVKNKLESSEKDLINLGNQLMMASDIRCKYETEFKSFNNSVKAKAKQIKDLEQQLKNSKSVYVKSMVEKQKEIEQLKGKIANDKTKLDQLIQQISELRITCTNTQRNELKIVMMARRAFPPSIDSCHGFTDDEIKYLIDLAKKAIKTEKTMYDISKNIYQNIDSSGLRWIIESSLRDDHGSYTFYTKYLEITFNELTIRFIAFGSTLPYTEFSNFDLFALGVLMIVPAALVFLSFKK